MTRKFFGTDGIRGRTNSEPMTAQMALAVGMAAGAHFLRGDHRHRVVIDRPTGLLGPSCPIGKCQPAKTDRRDQRI